jgi:hypothetical protein
MTILMVILDQLTTTTITMITVITTFTTIIVDLDVLFMKDMGSSASVV